MSSSRPAARPDTSRHHALRLLLCLVLLVPGMAPADDAGRPFVVGFAQDTLRNDWRRAQVESLARHFADHAEIRFIHTDGNGSTAKQVGDIEDLLHRRVDVLITSPRNGAASAPVIAKAYRAGIPVVLVTRAVPGDQYTTLVAPDDAMIGKRAARYMAQRLHGQGRILVLRGLPGTSTAQARTRGFLEGIAPYPGIRIVAIKDGNYLRADAIRAMEAVLAEGLAFDAIYAQSDSMAAGARLALRQAGIDPRHKLTVGIDYIHEAREAIRNGEQDASFLYPTCADEVAQVVLDILAGRSVPHRVTVDTRLITRDNVDQIPPIF